MGATCLSISSELYTRLLYTLSTDRPVYHKWIQSINSNTLHHLYHFKIYTVQSNKQSTLLYNASHKVVSYTLNVRSHISTLPSHTQPNIVEFHEHQLTSYIAFCVCIKHISSDIIHTNKILYKYYHVTNNMLRMFNPLSIIYYNNYSWLLY